MRTIFLNYARRDTVLVQALVHDLRALGNTVWLEEEKISGVRLPASAAVHQARLPGEAWDYRWLMHAVAKCRDVQDQHDRRRQQTFNTQHNNP
jgi:hypothetical protein